MLYRAPHDLRTSHEEYRELTRETVEELRDDLGEIAEKDPRVQLFDSIEKFQERFPTDESREAAVEHLREMRKMRKESYKDAFLATRLFGYMQRPSDSMDR